MASFCRLVSQALAASDEGPTGPVARYAYDRSWDVGRAVDRIGYYRRIYGMRRMPEIDREIAAVNLVLLAEREIARGVRVAQEVARS